MFEFLKGYISVVFLSFFLFTGIIFCPLICLIMTFGNSAIILGLWPVHCVWTYYSVFRWLLESYSLEILSWFCYYLSITWLLYQADRNNWVLSSSSFFLYACPFPWFYGQYLELWEVLLVEQLMDFSHLYFLHLTPLEQGSLTNYSTVYTYVEQCRVAFFLLFFSCLYLIRSEIAM